MYECEVRKGKEGNRCRNLHILIEKLQEDRYLQFPHPTYESLSTVHMTSQKRHCGGIWGLIKINFETKINDWDSDPTSLLLYYKLPCENRPSCYDVFPD